MAQVPCFDQAVTVAKQVIKAVEQESLGQNSLVSNFLESLKLVSIHAMPVLKDVKVIPILGESLLVA